MNDYLYHSMTTTTTAFSPIESFTFVCFFAFVDLHRRAIVEVVARNHTHQHQHQSIDNTTKFSYFCYFIISLITDRRGHGYDTRVLHQLITHFSLHRKLVDADDVLDDPNPDSNPNPNPNPDRVPTVSFDMFKKRFAVFENTMFLYMDQMSGGGGVSVSSTRLEDVTARFLRNDAVANMDQQQQDTTAAVGYIYIYYAMNGGGRVCFQYVSELRGGGGHGRGRKNDDDDDDDDDDDGYDDDNDRRDETNNRSSEQNKKRILKKIGENSADHPPMTIIELR